MSRYDADADGKLGYWEFANMFMPVDSRARNDLENRYVTKMTDDLRGQTRRMIQRCIEQENRIEELRQLVRANVAEPLRNVF